MTYSLSRAQRAFSSFPALPQINPRYEEERGNSQREALARLIISEILIREAPFSELLLPATFRSGKKDMGGKEKEGGGRGR
jgi:hypothetical protein